MLDYITHKKARKHKADRAAKDEAGRSGESSADGGNRTHSTDPAQPGTPVLDPADESFLERLLSDEGPRPPLPPRMKTPDIDWQSDLDASSTFGPAREEAEGIKGKTKLKEKEKDGSKPGRFASLFSRNNNKDKELVKSGEVPPGEEEREASDISRILNRLNLSVKNNKVIPLTTDSSDLLNRFTLIFKDLANGVPTAYDDLTNLIEDREGTLNKGFNKLPKSLQKLVMQLPEKVTGALGPEVLLAAAHAQGIQAEKGKGMKDQAGKIFMPQNIMQLVTKPGALIGMLKAIVNALRLRWPAFIGVNAIYSVALFLLMFVLWYCYKRGREVRLEKEKMGEAVDGSDRIEELPDDLMLPAPSPRRRDTRRSLDSDRYSSSEDDRSRRHERYRRHDEDVARREEDMLRREDELNRREEKMSRRSSRRQR